MKYKNYFVAHSINFYFTPNEKFSLFRHLEFPKFFVASLHARQAELLHVVFEQCIFDNKTSRAHTYFICSYKNELSALVFLAFKRILCSKLFKRRF